MMGWLDFFTLFYLLCLGFFFFSNCTVVTLLLYAEITWLVLYTISILTGAYTDDLTSVSVTFFILGFGGLEFVVGFLLVILLKNFQITLSTHNTTEDNNSQDLSRGNVNTRRWDL